MKKGIHNLGHSMAVLAATSAVIGLLTENLLGGLKMCDEKIQKGLVKELTAGIAEGLANHFDEKLTNLQLELDEVSAEAERNEDLLIQSEKRNAELKKELEERPVVHKRKHSEATIKKMRKAQQKRHKKK